MVIDGYLLPACLPEIFEAGEQAQVPLLLGWNSAENHGMAFMQGFFVNCIISRDPSGNGLPEWPKVEPDDITPAVMIINVESRAEEAVNDERYLFLDKKFREDREE